MATLGTQPREAGADDYRQEAGFVVLGLAQLLVMFGVWMGVWPASFGAGVDQGVGAGAVLLLAGVAGLYLAFDLLSDAIGVTEV